MRYSFLLLLVLLWSCDNKRTTNAPVTQAPGPTTAAPAIMSSAKPSATKPLDTLAAASASAGSTNAHRFLASGETLRQFVPAGYFIQYEAQGDISRDGIADVALILREITDSTSERAFVVLLGQPSSPKYKLADAGWNAIGPQCSDDGYPFRSIEQLAIAKGAISLELYDPGPAGNLFTTYRYIAGNVQLTERETFFQGAGQASRCHEHLLTGVTEWEEVHLLKEPAESTETTEQTKPVKILLHDSNPDEMTNNKNHQLK
ncbi:hypothetical protein IC235_14240 [Hymenobacter sp. BT664]|uniref:Uncharacterized protein n=1 Tax=Hymenobacter montanus TaxID=2771359 RepID=A0A927BFE1_9BACT|nr:hypothetical protein [Hymenobacter montanus]MBD2769049.1 hypothetical protein [Hymenobacter montanus]